MIPTRSASWSASSRYCVVRKTVVPSAFRAATSSQIALRLTGSRPVVGSSRNSTLRLVDERRGEVEAAAHAARVGADPPVGGLAEADAFDQRVAAALGLAADQPVERRLQADQLAPGHQRVERRLLQRDADRAAHVGRLLDDVEARHPGAAAGRAQERGQHAHGGRLPGAVRARGRRRSRRPRPPGPPRNRLDPARKLTLESCYLDCRHGGGIYRRAGRSLCCAKLAEPKPQARWRVFQLAQCLRSPHVLVPRSRCSSWRR